MSYLLDTNIISGLMCAKPAKAVLAWFDDVPSEALHISVLTLGEIRKGIEQMRTVRAARNCAGGLSMIWSRGSISGSCPLMWRWRIGGGDWLPGSGGLFPA